MLYIYGAGDNRIGQLLPRNDAEPSKHPSINKLKPQQTLSTESRAVIATDEAHLSDVPKQRTNGRQWQSSLALFEPILTGSDLQISAVSRLCWVSQNGIDGAFSVHGESGSKDWLLSTKDTENQTKSPAIDNLPKLDRLIGGSVDIAGALRNGEFVLCRTNNASAQLATVADVGDVAVAGNDICLVASRDLRTLRIWKDIDRLTAGYAADLSMRLSDCVGMPGFGTKVQQLAAGESSIGVLLNNGSVLTCGAGNELPRLLGREVNSDESAIMPQRASCLDGWLQITKIAAGGWLTGALSKTGDLLLFGLFLQRDDWTNEAAEERANDSTNVTESQRLDTSKDFNSTGEEIYTQYIDPADSVYVADTPDRVIDFGIGRSFIIAQTANAIFKVGSLCPRDLLDTLEISSDISRRAYGPLKLCWTRQLELDHVEIREIRCSASFALLLGKTNNQDVAGKIDLTANRKSDSD